MNLDNRAIQAHGLEPDADELLALQLGKYPIEHASLRPAAYARANRMPIAKPLGQVSPPAAILRDEQDRIDHVEVLMRDIAPLCRKMQRNARV
jgi:hypothetical protein